MGAATLAPKGAAGGSIKIACDASTAAPKRCRKSQQWEVSGGAKRGSGWLQGGSTKWKVSDMYVENN